jgi:hypothetical protein
MAVQSHPIVAQSQEGQKGTIQESKKGTTNAANAVDQGAPQRQAAPAASSEMEIEQLKKRLNQLEQTAEQLKEQLATLEQTRETSGAAVGESVSAPAGISQTAAKPETVAKAQGDPNPSGNTKPQVGESTFEVYGFVMLDAGYDIKTNDPNWFDVVRPTKLPAFEGEFAPNGKVYFGVRQTRFGVKSSTPTKYGDLKTQFEFELFGVGVDASQTTFRLRHAYGELGQFGAGQTWSPFMDIDVFPNQLEYWGPNGMVFFRNVQFRWMPLKGRNAVTIALERPGATADQGQFTDRIELQGVQPKFDLPDLSGNVRFTRDWGYFQVAGMLKRLKWRDTNQDQFDLSGKATGLGLNLTTNLKFGENSIGKLGVVYGKGIENYMNDAPTDVGIAPSNSGDPSRPIKGVALPVLGLTAFLDHNWNKRFSSTIGYSFENIENSAGQLPNAFHRGHYALTNLLFYPVENVMMGGEFQWGKRTNAHDGFSSNDYRVQFGFKYNFGKVFKTEK